MCRPRERVRAKPRRVRKDGGIRQDVPQRALLLTAWDHVTSSESLDFRFGAETKGDDGFCQVNRRGDTLVG